MAFRRRNRPKRTSQAAQDCLKLLRIVGPLFVAPLCLTSFVYTCLYAYIYATEGSYTAQDWERCLTVPNIGNLHMDNNRFCTSAANFAGQAYLALLVAVGGAFMGLKDNDLLPFSIFTAVIGIVGIIIFRESYPYFDDPHFMSTTLITLTKYIHPGMYDNLAENSHLPEELKDKIPSTEVCQTAYQVNLAFLCIQYGVLTLAILVLSICLYAYAQRPRRGGPRVPVKGRFVILAFGLSAFIGMLIMFISKEMVADIATQVGSNDGHGTTYPFTDNNLDLVSFTTLLAIGAAIYGLCKPSQAAFTLAAGVGLINGTRSVPGMLGTMAGYSGVWYPVFDRDNVKVGEEYYVLWDMDQCAAYVMQTNPAAFKHDITSEDDARDMCHYFIGSIGGQLLTWVSIVCLAITAIIILKRNPDIDKLVDIEQEKQWAKTRSGRATLRDYSPHHPLLADEHQHHEDGLAHYDDDAVDEEEKLNGYAVLEA